MKHTWGLKFHYSNNKKKKNKQTNKTKQNKTKQKQKRKTTKQNKTKQNKTKKKPTTTKNIAFHLIPKSWTKVEDDFFGSDQAPILENHCFISTTSFITEEIYI